MASMKLDNNNKPWTADIWCLSYPSPTKHRLFEELKRIVEILFHQSRQIHEDADDLLMRNDFPLLSN
jgi:hypothetical protein